MQVIEVQEESPQIIVEQTMAAQVIEVQEESPQVIELQESNPQVIVVQEESPQVIVVQEGEGSDDLASLASPEDRAKDTDISTPITSDTTVAEIGITPAAIAKEPTDVHKAVAPIKKLIQTEVVTWEQVALPRRGNRLVAVFGGSDWYGEIVSSEGVGKQATYIIKWDIPRKHQADVSKLPLRLKAGEFKVMVIRRE